MQITQSSNTVGLPGSAFIVTDTTVAPATLTFNTANKYNLAPAPLGMDAVTVEELDSEVFNTPVETLINLWLSRFSHEWVDLDMIEDDKFFRLAYRRLKSLGELEQHYLTDRARYVCRKPE